MTAQSTQSTPLTRPELPVADAHAAAAYNDPSWWYDVRGLFFMLTTYQVMLWTHLAFFARNVGKRHLEAAVGSGTFLALTLFTRWLLRVERPVEVVGIDYAERMLLGAKRLFRGRDVTLLHADLGAIAYPDGHFDSVNLAHSFHTLPEPERVLAELRRVLCPGGTLRVDILLAPRGGALRRAIAGRVNAFCYKKGILARLCDEATTVKQLEANGFVVVDTRVKGNSCHLIARREA